MNKQTESEDQRKGGRDHGGFVPEEEKKKNHTARVQKVWVWRGRQNVSL